jgi:hypothetical protein
MTESHLQDFLARARQASHVTQAKTTHRNEASNFTTHARPWRTEEFDNKRRVHIVAKRHPPTAAFSLG